MKKRIIATLVSAVLFCGLFAGCAKNEKASNGSVTTVTFWSNDASAGDALNSIVEEFNDTIGKDKKIKVELTIGGSNYFQTVDVAHQNDQLPDILVCTGDQLKLFLKKGDIVPIDSFDGSKEFMESVKGPRVDGGNVRNGKTYSLYMSTLTAGMIYNKDLFKKAGIVDENGEAKPPKTWEELREYAKKLTNKKEQVYGYSFPFKNGIYYNLRAPFSTSSDIKTDWDNLTVDHSELGDIFNLMLDLKKDGSLFPGSESMEDDTSRAYFAEGKIAMVPAISWDVAVYTKQFVAKCDWGVAPMPVKDASKAYPGWSEVAGGYLLSKNALEKGDKAFEFYKYLYSNESLGKFAKDAGKILLDTDIMNTVEKIDDNTVAFANLYDPERDYTRYPTYVVEGDNVDDTFKKIWSGELTVDEGIDYLNKNYEKGLKKAVENKEIDVTPFQTKK